MSLKTVAESNAQLKQCWSQGMQALQKKDKKLIKASTNTCNGSINIDACLQRVCPQDNILLATG